MLVDRELTERQNRRLERMLKAARLRTAASVEDIDFSRPRGLERAQVLRSPSRTGSTSTTRSSSSARPGWARPTYAARSPTPRSAAATRRSTCAGRRLHDEIALARADGRLSRLMAGWARIDVLVIDDFLLRPLRPDQAADLLEVIEDRVGLALDDRHEPAARGHVARGTRRADRRRRNLGPALGERSPHRAPWRVIAPPQERGPRDQRRVTGWLSKALPEHTMTTIASNSGPVLRSVPPKQTPSSRPPGDLPGQTPLPSRWNSWQTSQSRSSKEVNVRG